MSSTVGFYMIKMVSIFIMAVVYFIMGSGLSLLLNDIIPDENLHQISTPSLVALLSGIFGVIGIVFYLLRNLITHMPFVLEGYYGFRYSLLKEATGGLIVGYVMYAYLDKLKGLMDELAKRIRGRPHPQEQPDQQE